MRTADQWFDEYHQSHRHPVNQRLHWICVPAIVMAVIGLLWSLPVPGVLTGLSSSPWFNWATLLTIAVVAYYALLSPALALGSLPAFALLFAAVIALDRLPWPLWRSCLAVSVVAWIGQFAGHAIEGRRPSFFTDLQFLLIGPLWLLGGIYRALGLSYARKPPTHIG